MQNAVPFHVITICVSVMKPFLWNWSTGASEEQLQDTFVATERAIMSSIFKYAFYPNGEVDMERDRWRILLLTQWNSLACLEYHYVLQY